MSEWIYQTDADNTARYVLGCITDPSAPTLIVMSINPSIGAPDNTDPTLGTIRHISADYGYKNWIILSLYPQRATHLNELDEIANPEWTAENLKVINDILSQYPGTKIWAAWGTHIQDRWSFPVQLAKIVPIADKYGDTWMNYGPLTEAGDPRYCLYLEDGEGWSDFDMSAYLQNIEGRR